MYLIGDKSSILEQLSASESKLRAESNTNYSLRTEISRLQGVVSGKTRTMNNWEHDFNLIAQDLVDHSTPEQVREFERRGLHKTIGENIWKHAKETSRERIERREQEQEQGHGRSRGMRM